MTSYLRELRYILRSSVDMRTRVALATGCALFHFNNRFGRPSNASLFNAMLMIQSNYKVNVKLRTYSGDLFVLFEVLAEEAYHIPESILPRDGVCAIVDCGANIGLTSLYLAARYPKAKIYSVEPDAENFALLCLNTRYESRITPVRAAVVGRPCRTVRVTSGRESWRNQIDENGNGTEVPAFTIQEICDQYNIIQIDLLKVDIEGGEADVFRNGSFLNRVRFVIVELHGDYGEIEFAADMGAHGLIAARAGSLPGVGITTASPA